VIDITAKITSSNFIGPPVQAVRSRNTETRKKSLVQTSLEDM
jgi:hypothetical protein